VHDSKKEASRWMELHLLQKAGLICDLYRQVKFELIPKQDGERPCYYIADFIYHDLKSNKVVVEDVKSVASRKKESYIIKRKLMLYIHKIKIKEV
jgi:hypothetical protein